MFRLFTFNSTHKAILTEKTLIENDIAVKIIPVPRVISASCGLAARIKDSDLEKALNTLKDNDVEPDGLYFMDEKSNVKLCD